MKEYTWIFILISILVLALYLLKKKAKKEKPQKRRKEDTGKLGEMEVIKVLGQTIEGRQYILNNYMIEENGKSSQIDHIVINPYGVFVIETKNYSGMIYGYEDQQEWTQVLSSGKVKNRFYNPIKQNKTHVARLKKILPSDTIINSLVVMVQNNTENIQIDNVIKLTELKERINARREEVLSVEEMQMINNTLIKAHSLVKISDEDHINEIHNMRLMIDNNICPRCGGKIIEKQGKYGSFWSCSNYPKCRFIKK